MSIQQIKVSPDPYKEFNLSQAIQVGNLLFISGQTAINSQGQMVGISDFDIQAECVFRNLSKVLEAGNSTLSNVAKVTIYLRDMSNFDKIIELRKKYFSKPYPADTLVEVSSLFSPDALIEVDAIAVVNNERIL